MVEGTTFGARDSICVHLEAGIMNLLDELLAEAEGTLAEGDRAVHAEGKYTPVPAPLSKPSMTSPTPYANTTAPPVCL